MRLWTAPTWRLPERWDTHGEHRLVQMSQEFKQSRAYAMLLAIGVFVALGLLIWIADNLLFWLNVT